MKELTAAMKISLLQMHIALGDVEKNRAHLKTLVETAMQDQPDVLALPEMWSTGFYPKPLVDFADEEGRQTRQLLSALARAHRVNIVGGSVATRLADGFHNTCYVFDREGTLVSSYDKMHLFSPAREEQVFRGGTRLSTFALDGVKCGVVICYDLRFCELIRTLALQKIDLLFVPAAWPVERRMHWQVLNRARAIENQFFVAAVNGAGQFRNFRLAGYSALYDPWGDALAEASDTEEILSTTLDFSALEDIRSHINVFNDRKPECYCF